ncbi:MAG TPA: formate dehydrogenase subunit gamma [Gammaproteobacteria bacterium]|nr:formate dehydrogenase subunit gamma [Gammaproteobacteria bacterium]
MARVLQSRGSDGARRHKRIMLWSLLVIVLGSMVLPFTGYLYVHVTDAYAAAQQDVNPRANTWRAVRDGTQGYTSSHGPYATDVFIQNGGENWRQIRNGPVANIAPWVLAAVLLAIGLFYLVRGTARVEQERSGERVPRWNLAERIIHWYTAILFIILAITGLSLLFGRAALIPVFGLPGFSVYATGAMALHNYLGPFFVVGVLLEVVSWIKNNIPRGYDLAWIRQGMGMVRGRHPHSGKVNAGEKGWFWFIATFGIAVCVTGLIMDFPNFQQSRETMQIANIIHASLGVLWVAISFGHIYLGSIGVEGAFEGMATGKVSAEWARQHHDLWYEELKERGETGPEKPAQRPSPGPASS